MNKDILFDFFALGFSQEGIESATIRDVIMSFRKLASKLHPDKAGENSTAAFQAMMNLYQRVLKYLIDKVQKDAANSKDEEKEEDIGAKFTTDNFSNFNFPKENEGSFTVFVQDELADQWEEALENKYDKPTLLVGPKGKTYGKNWKVNFTADGKTIVLTVQF